MRVCWRCPVSGRRLESVSIFFASAFLAALLTTPARAQSPGQVLPTGMSITPLAAPGATFQALNPGLPSLPDFLADMAVTTALSPDGNTLLILTSGVNQNLNALGKVDRNTSNEYVFVFDVSGATPHQAQVIQIEANAFDGLTLNPSGNQFYVSGGPDDLIHV